MAPPSYACGKVVSRLVGVGLSALLAPLVVLATPAGAATVNASVTILESGYTPATVTIRPGQRVIWFNGSSRDHTVTSDSGSQLNSGTIAPGEELSVQFVKAGTYAYHSAFPRDHLRGTVVVAGAPAAAVATVTVTTTATTPYPITIPEGYQTALGDLTVTSPLLALLDTRQDDDTWWSAGLVVAAGITSAAVVVALLAYGRRRPRGESA